MLQIDAVARELAHFARNIPRIGQLRPNMAEVASELGKIPRLGQLHTKAGNAPCGPISAEVNSPVEDARNALHVSSGQNSGRLQDFLGVILGGAPPRRIWTSSTLPCRLRVWPSWTLCGGGRRSTSSSMCPTRSSRDQGPAVACCLRGAALRWAATVLQLLLEAAGGFAGGVAATRKGPRIHPRSTPDRPLNNPRTTPERHHIEP